MRSKRESLEKRLAAWTRRQGITSDTKTDFQSFVQKFQASRVAAFLEKMKSVPLRDGDVDLEALGLNRDEFIKRWSGELGSSIEDLLEAFLNSLESKV